jgi:hypothetical protein
MLHQYRRFRVILMTEVGSSRLTATSGQILPHYITQHLQKTVIFLNTCSNSNGFAKNMYFGTNYSVPCRDCTGVLNCSWRNWAPYKHHQPETNTRNCFNVKGFQQFPVLCWLEVVTTALLCKHWGIDLCLHPSIQPLNICLANTCRM